MINNQTNDQWNKLIDNSQRMINNLSTNLSNSLSNNLTTKLTSTSKTSAPQNITLQVNGEEEEKFLINKLDNSLKVNHDNGLSQSCLSLNEFNTPSSTQLSLDSLNSDTCIHAEAGRLFHQQLDKELSKVIPSAQRRKTSVETVHNRYKFNKKRKKNLVSNMANQPKKCDNLDFNPPNSNCPSIYEPLISNGFKNQFDHNNLLDPNAANKQIKDSNSVQSMFSTNQQANTFKLPCKSTTTSIGNFINKTNTPNVTSNLSNLNLKADLSPTNLRRRCIAKNGVANIRNAKISRKSQRFFLDFFNTMIDIEWHYNLLAFTLSFVISWLFFAVIWWSIAYQHGDLYKIEELDEVAVDLDKMNMNLNFLTDNIDNLNTENALSKSKRSIPFDDQDKILNKLAHTFLNNRTTIQQFIDHFNLSKLRFNSTSGTNIHHKMEDGSNITHFLSYAKNNENLKETFASHNISLNKIAKLVQPKRGYFNATNQQLPTNEQNDLKQLNNGVPINGNQEEPNQQTDKQKSLLMNIVPAANDELELLPQFPIANLTIEQRHQLENLFYLMQLQYLLQQERNKQQIAKFLTKLAKKAHHTNQKQNKPAHPPDTPPAHPLPDTSIQAIEEQEEKIQKEMDVKHKEQEKERQRIKLEKQEKLLIDILNSNNNLSKPAVVPNDNNQTDQIGNQEKDDLKNLQEQLTNDQSSSIPSPDAVIEEAVLKASESVLPKCGLNGTKSCRKVCLDNINSFADAILFSIETQHTIGYGTRQPRDCKIVLVVLMVQSIFGCLIQCFVVGFVFAKLSRPQNRHQTLVFSKKAVINLSEYDRTYDFSSDTHTNDNQFNLTFEELNDLVNLMKNGEMQEMMQDCACTNSETSSDQQNRRQSSDAISTDDLLQQQQNSLQGSYLNPFKDQNLLNLNFLNIPSNLNSKRSSNVSFLTNGLGNCGGLNSGLSTQSKLSNTLNNQLNNHLNLCCELEPSFDFTGNKNYKLQFRVGDVREKSHIINAKIQAYFLSKDNYCFKNDIVPKTSKFKYQLFKKRRSEVDFSNLKLNASNLNTNKIYSNYNELIMEKKLHNFTQKKMNLTIDSVEHSDGELLLIWPIVISHEVNENSPLYNFSKDEILNSKFEIVIVLEGTIESTGQSVQARTSYLPSEIQWGHSFLPVLQSDHEDSEFLVNFSMFNMTRKQQNMPSISSREYQIRKKFHKLCLLKKYMSKLSDVDLDNNELNTNLLSHIINSQNDNHNLNGLINNVDDLNNLNNLFSLLNKLVNHSNPNQQNNLTNHSNGSNNSANFLNFKNLSHSNSSSTNQFNYQPSLSVDQNVLNRKKSTDISNLLELIQQTQQNHLKSQQINKSRSSNNLNQFNNQANLVNLINNQTSQKIARNHDQKQLKRNDSEHITIEEDNLDREEIKTKTPTLKLLSLFQPTSFNNSQAGYENCNYAFYNSRMADHNLEADESKSNQANRKFKYQKNLNTSSRQPFVKSESYLNYDQTGFNLNKNSSPIQTQSSSNLINNNNYYSNSNLKSKSDWNLTRKRIL